MTKEQIEQIRKDIAAYEQAIENAEGALAEAERELEEALAEYVSDEEKRKTTLSEKPAVVEQNRGYPNEMRIEISVNGHPVISRTVIITKDLPF